MGVAFGPKEPSPGEKVCSKCGAMGSWEFLVDSGSGSTVMECKGCGFWVILGRGFVDQSTGMMLLAKNTIGSWGTFSINSTHISHEGAEDGD